MLSRKPYSVRADCFSVGCIYYRFLTGLRPFGDEGATLTFARNRKCKFHLEGEHEVAFLDFTTPESRDLILKLVTANTHLLRLSAKGAGRKIASLLSGLSSSVDDADQEGEVVGPAVRNPNATRIPKVAAFGAIMRAPLHESHSSSSPFASRRAVASPWHLDVIVELGFTGAGFQGKK